MHLTAAEWARIEALFPLAAELAGEARARFLERECADEPRVRSELEAMLAADATQDRLLDAPVTLTSTEKKPAAEGLAAGTRLGSWKVRSPIGTGGMGEVYLAERADGAYTMSVAIKLLKRELFSYANAQRFLRERRVLARLSHPNIARVLDAGTTDDGRPFLVMEYAPGARITDYARDRMLAPRQVAQLMVAVAEAVAEAHRHGVVHRDLKPANVMVSEPQQVKLLDFGIARLLDEAEPGLSSAVPMTPAYAAPEQILNGELTPATDVYALGVMLFQLLTHTLPHLREGLPLPVIAAGLRDEAVERPSRVVLAADGPFFAQARQKRAQEIEGELDRIVLKALHADPHQRHTDAAEFADDLRRCLQGGSERKYWAFISYSHQDEACAQWLHKALETWRVPRRLVGRPLGDETVPRRLFPVFRDRDELPSSHELGAVINQALRQSRNLIVVCSPRSATSRWVNEEIKAFRALGRSHRVFCLIVDGEPHASARPEIAFSECFPPALREEGFEPIAADARERKDGKAGAKLKLLSGLIGVGLDELKQREKQRLFWQRVQGIAAALAVVGLLAGSWQWFEARREAREREILIERLVENGRLELLDGRQARAAVYLNEAYKLGHDSVPLRYMLHQAMLPVDAQTGPRIRHGGRTVHQAAFSPDGKRFALLVESDQGVSARIYDAGSGHPLQTVEGVPEQPLNLHFFKGGERLLVTGLTGPQRKLPVTRIWNLTTGAPPIEIAGINGPLGDGLSPDGMRVLTMDGTGGAQIRDTDTGRLVTTVARGENVNAASFSPDGRLIALAEHGTGIGLWSVATGRRIKLLMAPKTTSDFTAVLFTPDNRRLLALTRLGDVRIWSVDDGRLQLAFATDSDAVFDLSFSRDARRLVTVGSNGYKVWSAARGVLLLFRPLVLDARAHALLSPDGNTLYTIDGATSIAEIWDVMTRRRTFALDGHVAGTKAIALNPTGSRLLLASEDGSAEIWSTTVNPVWTFQSFAHAPHSVKFDASGTRLLVGTYGNPTGRVFLQDLNIGAPLVEYVGHEASVWGVDFDPTGTRVLALGADGVATLWNAETGQQLAALGPEGAPLRNAIFRPDGSRLLVKPDEEAGNALPLTLWDPRERTRIAQLHHEKDIYGFDLSPSGDLIASSDASGIIKLWAADDGSFLHTLDGHREVVVSVAFSRDGRSLLSGSHDNTVRIWDIAAGSVKRILRNPALGLVNEVRFSPDESKVAIATFSGTAWLWDLHSDDLLTLKGHTESVLGSRFLYDGRVLLTLGWDGTIRSWDTETGLTLGIAAAHAAQIVSLDFSQTRGLLGSAGYADASIWDLALERRSPDDIAAHLRCRTPWQIADGALVQTQRQDCERVSGSPRHDTASTR